MVNWKLHTADYRGSPLLLCKIRTKGHLFCKQCLQHLQFKKTRYSSPNLSMLARADISCQFKKTRCLCRHALFTKQMDFRHTPYPSVLDFWKKRVWNFFRVGRTWFLVYFELDFYFLCNLQKSSSKWLKIKFVKLLNTICYQIWYQILTTTWIGHKVSL